MYLTKLKNTIILFSVFLLIACPQKGERIAGGNTPAVDLKNRFTTTEILSQSTLPPSATRIKFLPSSPEFVVLGKAGEVFHFILNGDTASFLGAFTIPEVAPAPAEIGLTDVAFDPRFQTNGFVYFCFTTGDNRWNRIVRVQWSNNYRAIENSLTTILNVDRVAPGRAWHGIYSITFADDGYLYAAIGEATQSHFSQDSKSLLGKLIRIAPKAEGGYDIPSTNPYVDDEDVLSEIVAFGLRTPFRILAWQENIFIADVGSNKFEEINLYQGGAANFGWPECEGVCSLAEFQNPILAIGHHDPAFQLDDPEAGGDLRHSISLGVIYKTEDDGDPYNNLLDGQLLFNDVFLGYARVAGVSANQELGESQHVFHLAGVTSMDVGPDDYIYGSTIFDSRIFRVELKTGNGLQLNQNLKPH